MIKIVRMFLLVCVACLSVVSASNTWAEKTQEDKKPVAEEKKADVEESAARRPVYILKCDSHIDPTMASYLINGIEQAQDENAQAVLMLMDTPGGLLTSTKDIVKAIFASSVPVIVFVYPNGAMATSAGTFITLSADIAAMAPVSTIGSASPVNASPSGQGGEMDETMKKKVENFAASDVKSIAKQRGRNVEWAEKAVREAANLTGKEAVEKNVVDYIATSVDDLMDKIDGKEVKLLETKETVALATAGAPRRHLAMSPWDKFLHYLSDPMVAMFLFLIAMYGIIYELANPGAIFPGVLGAIAILLLLYSFSVIPINAAGIAFVLLAIGLFIGELFTPGTGVLAAGGVVSMFFGLMMLFRTSEGFMVPWAYLIAVTVITALFFLFIVKIGFNALRKPYVSGREGVVGHVGEARTDIDPDGMVFVDGSLWSATADGATIDKGDQVVVTKMDGLKIQVKRLEDK